MAFVDVRVTLNGRRAAGPALVDSGAAMSGMSGGLLRDRFGVDPESLDILTDRHAITGGGRVPLRLIEGVEIEVLGQSFTEPMMILPTPYFVLGLKTFFERFNVSFEWAREKPRFHVEPIRRK